MPSMRLRLGRRLLPFAIVFVIVLVAVAGAAFAAAPNLMRDPTPIPLTADAPNTARTTPSVTTSHLAVEQRFLLQDGSAGLYNQKESVSDATAFTGSAPDGSCNEWRIVSTPNFAPSNSKFYNISSLSPTDVWAVGYHYDPNTSQGGPLAEHWDGAQWNVAPAVAPGNVVLHGIVAISANDVWAVGYDLSGTHHTATLHWDGVQWSVVSSPNVGTGYNELYAVSAISSNNVWAVGSYYTGNGYGTLVLHYDGVQWNVVPTPNAAGAFNNYLYGVSALSPNDIWAVGDKEIDTDVYRTLVLHYDGTQWSVAPSPNPGQSNNQLRGVLALSANNVWAVGAYRDATYNRALAMRWDGAQWSVYYTPLIGLSSVFYNVSALSPSEMYASGDWGSGGARRTLAMRWNGAHWVHTPSPSVEAIDNYAYGVTAIGTGDAWTAGSYGYDPQSFNPSRTLALHYSNDVCSTPTPPINTPRPTSTPPCQLAWNLVNAPATGSNDNGIKAMSAVSSTDVWAVGTRPGETLAMHWNGAEWSVVSSPSPGTLTNSLNGVAAFGPNDVWAVGHYSNDGVKRTLTMHWNGVQWSVVTSPNLGAYDNSLNAVGGLATDDLWAVGFADSRTLAMHWDGVQWTIVSTPNTGAFGNSLNVVAAVSVDDVWAMGAVSGSALTMHWDGAQWTIVPVPNIPFFPYALYGAVAFATDDVWAVGGGARPLSLHWDGVQWNIVATPDLFSGVLYAVAAVANDDIWAVGVGDLQDTLTIHWDGAIWTRVPSPDSVTGNRVFYGAAAASAYDVWAGGVYSRRTTFLAHYANPCTTSPTPTTAPRTFTSTRTRTSTRTITPTITNTPTPNCGPAWGLHSSPDGQFSSSLVAIAGNSPADIWAVGSDSNQSLTMHWDGAQWGVVSSPNVAGLETVLEAVAVVSANDVWAAGHTFNNSTARSQTLTMHWDGVQWTIVPSPNISPANANKLHSMAAVAANDVWAVGEYSFTQTRTLVQHWDGVQWTIVSSPNNLTDFNRLYGVSASGANDVWAVGQHGSGFGPYDTLAMHWDGSQWTIVSTPNVAAATNELSAVEVISSSDVWAVGAVSAEYGSTLTMHWDGVQWTIVPSPHLPNGSDFLTSVSAVSSNDVWAIGASYPGSGLERTFAMHWDGAQWTIAPTPNFGTNNRIYSVLTLTSNEAWAVGNIYASPSNHTLTLHYATPCGTPTPTATSTRTFTNTLTVTPTRTRTDTPTNTPTHTPTANPCAVRVWSAVTSPNAPSTPNRLEDVDVVAADDIWAVGYTGPAGGPNQTLIEHWNGSQWSIVSSPNLGSSQRLEGLVQVGDNDIWAVGSYRLAGSPDDHTLIIHWDGATWSEVAHTSPARSLLHDISAAVDNDIWAVGSYDDGGLKTLTMHWNGNQWTQFAAPNPGANLNELLGVEAIGAANAWAVGYSYSAGGRYRTLAMHWDGATWAAIDTPNMGELGGADNYLYNISGMEAVDSWAIGAYDAPGGRQTTVMHFGDNEEWQFVPAPSIGGATTDTADIEMIATDDVWAVGDGASGAMHWNGSQWSAVSRPDGAMRGLSASGTSLYDVWAVGNLGNDTRILRSACFIYTPTPTNTPTNTHTPIVTNTPRPGSGFLEFVPGAAGNCPAPPNGGSSTVGCRFVLDLMLDTGAYNDVLSQQSMLTFTYELIRNARVSTISSNCVQTSTVTADPETFDTVLQNEVCNGPGQCNFRGTITDPGSFAFGSAAGPNCPEGCGGYFRVAQVGLCAISEGAAVLHWQFSPPDPLLRDTQIVNIQGDQIRDPVLFSDYVINIEPGAGGTSTPTNTGLVTLTPRATSTPQTSVTNTRTVTRTRTPTNTPTYTHTNTRTNTGTRTYTPCPACTSTPTGTTTHTRTITRTATLTPCVRGPWNVVVSPNLGTGNNKLDGVAALSANNVWAVGNNCIASPSSCVPLIEHWDGVQWTVVASPNPITSSATFLTGVAAVSANDVWTVGYFVTAQNAARTLIMHWDGAQWSIVPSPNTGAVYNELLGITAVSSNDIWAVGYYGVSEIAGSTSLTMHWDGAQWSIVPAPTVNSYSQLLGVTAVSANDVWAVGFYIGAAGVHYTLTEHWNGSQWSVVTSPNLPSTYSENRLAGIAAASTNDVWAVGASRFGSSLNTAPLIMHWDGLQWTLSTPPILSGSIYLSGAVAVSSNDVWAVGVVDAGEGEDQRLAVRWNGTQWDVSNTPHPVAAYSEFSAITLAPPYHLVAVGSYRNGSNPQRTLVETYFNVCLSTVTPTPSNTPVLAGHLVWQGRPTQPHTLQQMPITLTLKLGDTEVNYPSQNTDASGRFTMALSSSLSNGAYAWRAKGPQYLAKSGTVVLNGDLVINLEMGLMLAADANNDNLVNSVDFVILQNSFGIGVGEPDYDERAEFTGNGIVNTGDFVVMKRNFGQSGAPPIRPGAPRRLKRPAGERVWWSWRAPLGAPLRVSGT